jgi:hypothetical protein
LRPAWANISRKGAALPSPIGGSFASSSIKALSISSPRKAESKCSTVLTLTLPSAKVVARSTCFTFSKNAGIVG